MGNIAKSLSEQISKILATLSEASWLPSLLLVIGATFVNTVGSHPVTGIDGSLTAISHYSPAQYGRLLVIALLCTVLLQGLHFRCFDCSRVTGGTTHWRTFFQLPDAGITGRGTRFLIKL